MKKGERLLVFEAIKMQTTVYAPVDGTVAEVIVKARDSVEARAICFCESNGAAAKLIPMFREQRRKRPGLSSLRQ